MSSILKALKKIDEHSQSPESAHPWPQPLDAQGTITGGIKRRWSRRRMTTCIVTAACLLTVTMLLMLRQGEKPARLPRNDGNGNERAAAAPPEPAVSRSKIDQAPAPGEPPAASPPRIASKPPAARQTVPAAPKKNQPIDREPPAARPLSKSRPQPASPAAPPQTGEKASKPATVKAVNPGRPSSAEQSPTYSRLQSADLELQAIAWSPEPAKRIAVINGRIVREGEAVGAYTLMRIRPDDIVLHDGSKSWQVIFGLRR